jgi:lysine N6-hydroxylase
MHQDRRPPAGESVMPAFKADETTWGKQQMLPKTYDASGRRPSLTALDSAAHDQSRQYFTVVGIGAGPANLSLASLLYGDPAVSNVFIDRKPAFGWHDGQQIPGATLQVSPLKDLVSLSDPTSPFSFLSYLHSEGKIYHFINAQFDAVPRQEFRNYLEWASRQNENVVFGEEVCSVDFDGRFVVKTDRRILHADNVVLGVGSQPWVPACATLGRTQFHVNEFVRHAVDLGGKKVVVVGGGQSGAEAFLNLLSRSGDELPSHISWISRRPNFLPIDDSPFTNDYYMPGYSDYFAGLDADSRSEFNTQALLSSDGISMSTLRDIYQRAYVHRFVDGTEDLLALYPNRHVLHVDGGAAGGWDLTLKHNGHSETVEHIGADVVVWATGFRPAATEFLAPIAHRLDRSGDELRIDDDFAICWDGPADRNLFVQNAARQQRGLADPNLSLIAWRSQRIRDRVRGRPTGPEQRDSFIRWSAQLAAEKLLRRA